MDEKCIELEDINDLTKEAMSTIAKHLSNLECKEKSKASPSGLLFIKHHPLFDLVKSHFFLH